MTEVTQVQCVTVDVSKVNDYVVEIDVDCKKLVSESGINTK